MTDADSAYLRCKSDIGWRLIGEFSQWYGRLGKMGEIPRAFAGVTPAYQQVIVILTGLPFEHVERREFLIWLCRQEKIDAYVYGTHIMSAKLGETPTEELALYASSHRFNINASFAPNRNELGRIDYIAQDIHVADASSDDATSVFYQMQRSNELISDEAALRYSQIWQKLRGRCMWRDLRGPTH